MSLYSYFKPLVHSVHWVCSQIWMNLPVINLWFKKHALFTAIALLLLCVVLLLNACISLTHYSIFVMEKAWYCTTCTYGNSMYYKSVMMCNISELAYHVEKSCGHPYWLPVKEGWRHGLTVGGQQSQVWHLWTAFLPVLFIRFKWNIWSAYILPNLALFNDIYSFLRR